MLYMVLILISFVRVKRGNPGFAMVINTGSQATTLDISNIQGMGETVRYSDRWIVRLIDRYIDGQTWETSRQINNQSSGI